jgi:DNA-binding NarL/FixJ family response regulator
MSQNSNNASAARVGVLVVDDHAMFRQGLVALLERADHISVVGEAADGREAVKRAIELKPDVVLMNVTMPGLNGIDATRQITHECKGSRVLALSSRRDRRTVESMLSVGASGYVLKDCSFDELIGALRAVAEGRSYLSATVADALVKGFVEGRGHDQGPLSAREREVLQLISEGFPTGEIAQQLHISTKTVDTHRRQIMGKLGARSIAELTKYAIREGLTSLE